MYNLNKGVSTHTQAKIKLVHAFSKLFAILLFGGSVFFFSVKTAIANDTKKFDFPDTFTKADEVAIQNSNGRYKMELTAVIDGSENTYYYILAYDTQTGRSRFYYGSKANGLQAAASKFQLPSRPVQ